MSQHVNFNQYCLTVAPIGKGSPVCLWLITAIPIGMLLRSRECLRHKPAIQSLVLPKKKYLVSKL
jgi:hypothetical protein